MQITITAQNFAAIQILMAAKLGYSTKYKHLAYLIAKCGHQINGNQLKQLEAENNRLIKLMQQHHTQQHLQQLFNQFAAQLTTPTK